VRLQASIFSSDIAVLPTISAVADNMSYSYNQSCSCDTVHSLPSLALRQLAVKKRTGAPLTKALA
jgi:hypothetical protein